MSFHKCPNSIGWIVCLIKIILFAFMYHRNDAVKATGALFDVLLEPEYPLSLMLLHFSFKYCLKTFLIRSCFSGCI